MTIEEIRQQVTAKLGTQVTLGDDPVSLHPAWRVAPENLREIASLLKSLYFDHLACITGIDNGEKAGTMEVIYNFYSIPWHLHLALKVELKRNQPGEPLPCIPSLTPLWGTANWHEREIYDLLGIDFAGHPDLRRILMPADWQGHPLRKDYELQPTYHGIKTEY